MADQTVSLTCPICFEAYTATADPHDRRPTIVCRNGHTMCAACANDLDTCPTCHEPKMVVLNRIVIDIIAERLRQNLTVNDTKIPEISAEHIKRAAEPFAGGAYADVYDATWQNQMVALKVLRRHVVTASVLRDTLEEARLAMSLNHPNVVRVFGVVSIDGGKGLLMEKADRGSLRSALDNNIKLSESQQISVSIDIVDGLDYIHSKQMVHRDLKPENVLLFDIRPRLIAKITDFGTSKVVQTLAGTAMVGTPHYMAPELFRPQARYSLQVDVYSVAIVLYEVFSGRNIQDAYAALGIVNQMQLLMCVTSGQRPEIAESFPAELRTVIERGWSTDSNVRPTLAEIRQALCRLKATTRDANATASAGTGRRTIVSTSGDADGNAAFETQLLKLENSTKAYKLADARSQAEVCRRLWMRLYDSNPTKATASTATARFHSVKGYVHDWFGQSSDAYKETYQALTEMYELSVRGVSVEGEQAVTILRYAAEVCWTLDQCAAAFLLVSYAVRYAKCELSAAAYADALESFCCISLDLGRSYYAPIPEKVAEFVLSTRLDASVSANKPQLKVAIAQYYLAYRLTKSAALENVVNQVDADNTCKSLGGNNIYRNATNEKDLEEAKECLEDALEIAERILGRNNKTVAEIYFRLASTLKVMKYFGEAEGVFKIAIDAAENSLGPNCLLVGWIAERLADMYTGELRKYQEAEKLYLRSVEIHKSLFGPGHLRLSHLYRNLGDTCTKLGQTTKAANYYRLKSVVESGELEDKFKSTREALEKLENEVLRTLGSASAVSVAPGELVDVLHNFFKVASKPQPL